MYSDHTPAAARRAPNRRASVAAWLTVAALALSALTSGCTDTPLSPVARNDARATRATSDSAATSLTSLAPRGTAARTVGAVAPAAPAKWTVMVYLAADNNLAPAGVADVDEIEAGVEALTRSAALRGAKPGADVQVVVEGEFSRHYLEQAGCVDPTCVGLTSWNTFRYAVAGRAPAEPGAPRVYGPTGPVVDLGANRDMTRPEELREFVRWAKQVRPAEHYLLVLWNHGGGYTGLIADESSAGSRLMTIDGMRDGLADVGPIDVLDFDMCLMAGYETLAKIAGVARTAVFSEATVPGAGNEYASLLGALGTALAKGAPSAGDVAALTADRFHASYTTGRETTTMSAYDLAGFAAFDASLGRLADGLRTRLADGERGPDVATAIHDAVASSQRFDYAPLHDVGDALDSLAARLAPSGDRELLALVADARARAAAPGFRLRSHARTGSAARALDVGRATGLGILWPSGDADDAVRDAGPSSLQAYSELFPDRPWTRFLETYLAAASTVGAYDQEDAALQAFLLWDPAASARGVDVDLWVLEPDGTLYIPYLGRVTPNGELTADSWDTGYTFEGYATYRFVSRGTYYLFANLVQDSTGMRPRANLAYRHGGEEEFDLLYERPFRLSFAASYLDDPDATLRKAIDGEYSDLQLVAAWTPDGGDESATEDTRVFGAARGGLVPARRADADAGPSSVLSPAERDRMPNVSAAQLATARRMAADVRARRAGGQATRGLPDATARRLGALGVTGHTRRPAPATRR